MSGLLHRIAARLCDEATISRVVDPWFSDYRFELAGAAHWMERAWIHIVYLVSWCRLISVLLWRSEDVARVIAFQFAGVVIATVLVLTGPLRQMWRDGVHPVVALWLLPMALTVGVPFGVCLGLACTLRGCRTSASRAAAVIAAVACSLSTTVLLQWVLPDANQTFRLAYANHTFSMTARRPVVLLRGVGEMSLTELAIESKRARQQHERNVARCEMYGRLTLVTAPIALTLFLLLVVSRTPFPPFSGFLVIAVYYACMAYQRQWLIRSPSWMLTIAWTPTLLLLIPSLVAMRHRSGIG